MQPAVPYPRFDKTRPPMRKSLGFAVAITFSFLGLDLRAGEDPANALATLASEHTRLANEMNAVLAACRQASPEVRAQALGAWQAQNSERFAGFRRRAQELAAAARPPELPAIEEIHIPTHATPEAEEFLVQQAQLSNERIRVENQLRDATPQARRRTLEAWEMHTEARRMAQRELATQIARQEPVFAPLVPLELPAGIDSRLGEIFRQQRALSNERAELANSIRLLPPDEQETKLRQWDEKNSSSAATLRDRLIKQISGETNPD